MTSFGESVKGALVRELGRIRAKGTLLWLTIFLPLLTTLFFIWLFQAQTPSNLPVGVVDLNNSTLSRKLVTMMNDAQSLNITHHFSDLGEGRRALEKGQIYALVAIDADFQKKLYSSRMPSVVCWYNNIYTIPAGAIAKDIFEVQRTFALGLQLNKHLKKGETLEFAKAQLMPVVVNSEVMFNSTTNYFYYLVTALIPVMLQIFILTASVFALGSELKEGTAMEWLDAGNDNIFAALIGKFIPYFILFSLTAIFVNSLLFRYMGVPVRGDMWFINLSLLVMIGSYIAIAILLVSITPVLRMALSIASLYGAMAFSFAGITFPKNAMPHWAQVGSNAFAFTHYLKIVIDQAFRGSPLNFSLMSFVALLLFYLLPFFSVHRLEMLCRDEEHYGKH